MKRAYTKPILQIEEFIPQEYVASCTRLTGAYVQCARPGKDASTLDGAQYGSNYPGSIEGKNPNLYTGSKHPNGEYYHGGCFYQQTIYIDGSLTGQEKIALNDGSGGYWYSPIKNILIGGESDGTYENLYEKEGFVSGTWDDIKNGGTFEAAWQSWDPKGSVYHHYGALTVDATISGFS